MRSNASTFRAYEFQMNKMLTAVMPKAAAREPHVEYAGDPKQAAPLMVSIADRVSAKK